MYVQRNIEARSQIIVVVERNNYYLRVCVRARMFSCVRVPRLRRVHARACVYPFFIEHATRIRHVVTSFLAPLSPPIFFDIVLQTAWFSEKNFIKKCSTTFV
jgi:hypothetical protein